MTMPDTEAPGSRADAAGGQNGGSAREQIREVKDQVVGQAKTTIQQARDRASSSLGESRTRSPTSSARSRARCGAPPSTFAPRINSGLPG